MCNPTQCRYLAQAAHLVVSLARGGTIRAVARESAELLGYDPPELPGKALSDLVPAGERAHLARILERCQTDQSVWDELTVAAADGRPLPMLCCFQRYTTPGDRDGLLVTGHRLAAFQVNGQTHAAALLGQLAFRCHGPAHRLMQAMEGILAQYPWSEAVEQCRAELDNLLDCMSLSITSPRGEGAAGGHGAVDVVRILESALRLMDRDPLYRGLEVSLRPEAAAVWAAADPVGLVFLALHLARGARDSTVAAKSPRLLIDVYAEPEKVVLEFKDNGTSLAHQDLQNAFTPFFRSAGDPDGHTGLALSTCQEIVEYMGGTIRIQSRPSKGTTVFVTLRPAAPRKS